MKNLIFCIGCFLFSFSLSAQWTFGPKVAYGTVVQKSAAIEVIPQSDFIVYDLQYMGSTAVTSIGFMAAKDLGPVFLQAECLATTYGSDFFLNGYKDNNDNPSVYRETYYFLEIPFTAGANFKNFKFGLGPVMDVRIDHNSELGTMDDYRDTSKSMDFGFQGMIGYNLGIFHFDMRYVNKFTSIVDGFSLGYDNFRYTKSANRLSMSVGVAF